MELSGVIVQEAQLRATETLLRVGSVVAATVRQPPPPQGGPGLLSLAGQLLPAKLPPGLEAGQQIRLRVQDVAVERVVLQVVDEAAEAETAESGQGAATDPSRGPTPHAAGALAVAGDGQLVRVAQALTPPGLALPLPNGDAVELAIADEEAAGADGAGGGSEAGFVLHSAAFGPIEVRLRLAGGAIGATVSVGAGALPTFRAAAPDLASALARATGAAPQVSVAARPPAAAKPGRPEVAGGLDAYA
jgi:hypothetical protein